MPKLRPAIETIYNEGLGGVKVTFQLHSQTERVEIKISTPVPCAWNGKILDRHQSFLTDELGRVIVMLPPSSQLVPLTVYRGPRSIPYKMSCKAIAIGTLSFEVPDLSEWVFGTETESEEE